MHNDIFNVEQRSEHLTICDSIMLSVCCCRQSVDTMISELDNFCCGLLIFLKVKHYDPEHKLILVFL